MKKSADYAPASDLAADVEVYADEVRRFCAGGMAPTVFKAKRVPRGVYEQRRDGMFMLRVRVPGGVLKSAQAKMLAELSRCYGDGILHITTRQDVQIHDIQIENTPVMMRELLKNGMTSKGGGGNTVRNITTCPYAGICRAERFDVTPCADAVTAYLVRLVGSYNLPRKYKIAFSGCRADCALAQVADLGFIAEIRDGRPGFRLMAGGGMGLHSRPADILCDWQPAGEIIRTAETVRRLFDRLGDRNNRQRARLRFAVERIGVDEFRRQYAATQAETIRDGVPAWGAIPELNAEAGHPSPPVAEWHCGMRVISQRQKDFFTVPLASPLGLTPADDFSRIADLAARYSGEAGLRASRQQSLAVRFVRRENLSALADELHTLPADIVSPAPIERFVVCAGAATCRLGICLARNAARAGADALGSAGIGHDVLAGMDFHVNGCANSCGHQPIGAIGCYGVARRINGRLSPSYTVTAGGRCDATGVRFGLELGTVSARALPACLTDMALDFGTHRLNNESFSDYFDRTGREHFEKIVGLHAHLPDFNEQPDYWRDLGADEEFSLAGRGAGECGAGVFEVIRQDLAAARRAVAPFDVLLATARALLITRGVDARDETVVLQAFREHFVDSGLVPAEFAPLLDCAGNYLRGCKTAFDGRMPDVARLRERVELLYETLDADLRFHPPGTAGQAPPPVAGSADIPPANTCTVELDLHGVSCPLNFVKAKLKLEDMNTGETLAVILDDGEPVRNVPASFRAEGREIMGITDIGGGLWRVTIKK